MSMWDVPQHLVDNRKGVSDAQRILALYRFYVRKLPAKVPITSLTLSGAEGVQIGEDFVDCDLPTKFEALKLEVSIRAFIHLALGEVALAEWRQRTAPKRRIGL